MHGDIYKNSAASQNSTTNWVYIIYKTIKIPLHGLPTTSPAMSSNSIRDPAFIFLVLMHLSRLETR